MKQFVPLTDEMLYGTGGPPAVLIPYRCGMPCLHADRSDAGDVCDRGIDGDERTLRFTAVPESAYRRA